MARHKARHTREVFSNGGVVMAIKWVIAEQGSESNKVRWYGWVRFEKVVTKDKDEKGVCESDKEHHQKLAQEG
jgi:hypothetical protein